MMCNVMENKLTGMVMPVGNGAVGKTSLALALGRSILSADWTQELAVVHKTKNLEFEFVCDQVELEGNVYRVVQQCLIPPGQKKLEGNGNGRSYEDVIEIYRFHIRKVDVVLLAYKITQLESFHDLAYWVYQVNELCNQDTSFILVGTHLDLSQTREVLQSSVDVAKIYITDMLRSLRPDWRGECMSLEVSNLNGMNLQNLRHMISRAILQARGVAFEHATVFDSRC